MTTPPKLLGKYKTPKFHLGAIVRCARRGDVRIVGQPDAPGLWARGAAGRRLALVPGATRRVRSRVSAEG
jgi:hypothetical protein